MANSASFSSPLQDLLGRAASALDRGDARQADELALQVLQNEPVHQQAHYIAGTAAMALGQSQRALQHLHEAASRPPRRADYVVEFAKALLRTRRHGEALHIASVAMSLAPRDPMLLSTLGLIYNQCHAHERATAVFREAAALAPDNPACRFNYAMSLAFSGKGTLARSELDACLRLQPYYWPAHGLLSRLQRQTIEHNHVQHLLMLLTKTGDNAHALSQLHMALGKEYEDLGEYDLAFEHFTAGKSATRHLRDYSTSRDEAIVQALINAFPEPMAATAACLSDEPVFVIGMPRSGTTLVERILSSHPEVYAAGELDNFNITLNRLAGEASDILFNPALIARVGELPWEKLGEQYLASTRPLTSLKPRFIDKFPHNFLYAGFIACALPNARIICLRRHPLDTCLGNLREPFTEVSPFHGYSFDLMDIGRYYILFDRLMAHWKRVLPGRVFEVDYESLVTSPEASTRRLLEHCQLPWNDACLHHERNLTPATTASSLQVRAPLNRDSLQRWKRYEGHLTELRSLLTSAGIACDD